MKLLWIVLEVLLLASGLSLARVIPDTRLVLTFVDPI
jgi:hypothetical protein